MDSISQKRLFVGLDYHQESVQVCVMDSSAKILLNKKCRNDWEQIDAAVKKYGSSLEAAVESCCGARNLAQELSEQANWNISLAHAGFVARMKQNPEKTDYSDARLLADLVRVGYLPKVWLAPDAIIELRRLVRFRQQLANERRSVKLRIRGLLRDERIFLSREECGAPWTKRWLARLTTMSELQAITTWILQQQLQRLAELNKRLQQVEQQLEAFAANDAVVRKLRTFKGIGLITAVTMRAEIAQFERFQSGKQLARFCGLTPQNASSGQRQADAGLVKTGNRQLRMVLIEAGHRLLRNDPRWHAWGCQLLRRGKPKSVVVAAVANRWIRWLYHQMQPESLAA